MAESSSLLHQFQRAFLSPGILIRVKQEPTEDPPPVEDPEETVAEDEEEEKDDVVTNEEVTNQNGPQGQLPKEDDGFLFEIRFEGQEGSSRSIHLEDLLEPTFEALMIEIKEMGGGGDYTLFRRGTGKHSARIWQIGNTRELHHALKDYKSEGFVSIDVKAKRPALKAPPVAVTPEQKTPRKRKTPSGAAAKPQKKKPKPVTPRAVAAVPNPATPLIAMAADASLATAAAQPRNTGSGRPKTASLKQKEANESARMMNPSDLETLAAPVPDVIASGAMDEDYAPEPDGADDDDVSVTVSNKKGSVHEKVCNALLELVALHIPEPPRVQVALFSGYSNPKSAGFTKALSLLSKQGTIEYPSKKTLRLSQAGLVSLPPRNPPKDNAAVQERLRVILGGKKGKVGSSKTNLMFEALNHGQEMLRSDLAATAGYTNMKSAGFTKALSQLSSLGLLTYPDKTSVVLTDICFPYGRPNA